MNLGYRALWVALLSSVGLFWLCSLAWAAPHDFLYVANQGSEDISGFAIDARSGSLAPVPGSPFAVPGCGANQICVTSVMVTGHYVYVTGPGEVSGFAIDSETGALTLIAGSPFPAPAQGGAMEATVDPAAKVLSVVHFPFVFNEVSAFTINPENGALTPIPGLPTEKGYDLTALAIASKGRFVYVANSANVAGFSIDSKTGNLTPVPNSPFSAGTTPISIALEPQGKFAYVANEGSNNISAFSLNARSGALTLSGTFQAGSAPVSIVATKFR
jgi:6-phosphogluconolactonase